eukprot:1958553-Heterocapsa_arctica.AAC.1
MSPLPITPNNPRLMAAALMAGCPVQLRFLFFGPARSTCAPSLQLPGHAHHGCVEMLPLAALLI